MNSLVFVAGWPRCEPDEELLMAIIGNIIFLVSGLILGLFIQQYRRSKRRIKQRIIFGACIASVCLATISVFFITSLMVLGFCNSNPQTLPITLLSWSTISISPGFGIWQAMRWRKPHNNKDASIRQS